MTLRALSSMSCSGEAYLHAQVCFQIMSSSCRRLVVDLFLLFKFFSPLTLGYVFIVATVAGRPSCPDRGRGHAYPATAPALRNTVFSISTRLFPAHHP